MRTLLALLLTGAAATVAAQQMYKWKDEKGVTHYGERPGGKDAKAVELKSASPPSEQANRDIGVREEKKAGARPGETEQQRAEREFQQRQRQRERDLERDARRRADAERDQRRSRQAACEGARRQIRAINANPAQRGYSVNEIRSLEETVAKNC
jgi:hypothetical protein